MEARSSLALALFGWAHDSLLAEVKAGFPLLKGFAGAPNVDAFLGVMLDLPSDKRESFAAALVKRYHVDASAVLGLSLTSEEQRLIESYLSLVRAELAPPRAPASLRPELPRSSIRQQIVEGLADRYGRKVRRDCDGQGGLRLESQSHGMFVSTVFQFERFANGLNYWHEVWNQENQRLSEFYSLFSLFGIPGSPIWEAITEESMPTVIGEIKAVCDKFFSGLPRILGVSKS